jgi:malonyl CoA-acyl carrier protein transacylase
MAKAPSTKTPNEDRNDIAIIGMSCLLPGASTPEAFAQFLVSKGSGIIEVPKDRWAIANYYDPNRDNGFATYSKIGGFVRDYEFPSLKFRIPPKVAASMDQAQQWAVSLASSALIDAGYGPEKDFDRTRVGVVLGNSMGGTNNVVTSVTCLWPEISDALRATPEFAVLPKEAQERILEQSRAKYVDNSHSPVNEDTMPGELANVHAGRVASVLNLRGPNFVCDAACASSLAAVTSASRMLQHGDCDMIAVGGVDAGMGPENYIKFCRIGALSPDGSRPFDEGANGFVMGEGGAFFILKRLSDARRDGDRVLAVLRGAGASADGKGKGITAPNPEGQILAMKRAYKDAGFSPSDVSMVEAHGTGTSVGDATEAGALNQVFGEAGAASESISLGSVKSNLGHLKAGAGAAGLAKVVLALHNKVSFPTINVLNPNPKLGLGSTPFRLQLEAEPWTTSGESRIAGMSAFGFGGTNFHLVLEEAPEGLSGDREILDLFGSSQSLSDSSTKVAYAQESISVPQTTAQSASNEMDLPGTFIGFAGDSSADIAQKVAAARQALAANPNTNPSPLAPGSLQGTWRLVVGGEDLKEASTKLDMAEKIVARGEHFNGPDISLWSGDAGKIAFVYPGQGSQYVGMGMELAKRYPEAARVFDEVDRIMADTIQEKLSEVIWGVNDPEEAKKKLEFTVYTQPAVLAMDMALANVVKQFGVEPSAVAGHSLGEYGAVAAAGVMNLEDTVRVVSSRAREMANVNFDDNGTMAALLADEKSVERVLALVEGMVVAANRNSPTQTVVAGATDAMKDLLAVCEKEGLRAVPLPVSHAFHSPIVEPATKPLRKMMDKLTVNPPKLPIYSDVTAERYPEGPDATTQIKDLLGKQVAASVDWVGIVRNMKRDGYTTFIEVGPMAALSRFVSDTLGKEIVSISTNHVKRGDIASLRAGLVAIFAAGHGYTSAKVAQSVTADAVVSTASDQRISEKRPSTEKADVVISGASLGLPGRNKEMFDPSNIESLLRGDNRIETISDEVLEAMVTKNIERLKKSVDGSGNLERIHSKEDVVQLAGIPGKLDLVENYEVPKSFNQALDITTRMVIAAGLEALKDAGVPVITRYRETRSGQKIPAGIMVPEFIGDSTGVVFASAFPGYDSLIGEFDGYSADKEAKARVQALEEALATAEKAGADKSVVVALSVELDAAREAAAAAEHPFDRRFLFRILAMGHTQLAQFLGLRGPTAAVNGACASTTMGVAMAHDWIQQGRCERVLVVGADAVSNERMMPWFGSGFLAAGAATTESDVSKAAVPFGTQRSGMIVGSGAVGLLVEQMKHAQERGMVPLARVLSTQFANSAFHGTRLDVDHISGVFKDVVDDMVAATGRTVAQIAAETVFMSHETYTPARGGSSEAEAQGLRNAFGASANLVRVANTKGYTGHPMGAGIEDGLLLKILQHGKVPPLANDHDLDSAFSDLNLSRGEEWQGRYGVRLGAGFGSQLAFLAVERLADGVNTLVDQAKYDDFVAKVVGANAGEAYLDGRILKAREKEGAVATEPAAVATETPEVVTSVAPAAAGVSHADALKTLTNLVAEQTGYPADMLGAELDLEADLGIDTVKQAELFAAMRERYGIPPVEDLKLQDFNTLDKIAGFIVEKAGGAPAAAPVSTTPVVETPKADAAPAQSGVSHADALKKLTNLVAEQTGYPADMLGADLDLEADLGIDTVKQAELFAAMREHYGIAPVEDLKLQDFNTLDKIAGFVVDNAGGAPAAPAPVKEATPEPTPTPAPTQSGGVDHGEALSTLTNMVAEQTGYPAEMLGAELDLEADLGIDTVKQAELFAAMREHYGIAPIEDLKLQDYNTLDKIAGFVVAHAGDAPATPGVTTPVEEVAPESTPASTPTHSGSVDHGEALSTLTKMVADQTGYPAEMLGAELDLEADLGIDTVKQAELFAAMREHYGIAPVEDLKLQDYNTLDKIAGFVVAHAGGAPVASASVSEAPVQAAAAAPISKAAGAVDHASALKTLTEMVADQTGYPSEMLGAELDLEADLGIDTVKQAELFAAMREHYGIAPVEDLKLQDYNTLEKIAGFVVSHAGGTEAASAPADEVAPEPVVASAPVQSGTVSHADALKTLTDMVAEQTGYPAEMLGAELDLEADLGIDTVKQAELFAAMREHYGIAPVEDLKLQDYNTLERIADFVVEHTGVSKSPVAAATSEAAAAPTASSSESSSVVERYVPGWIYGGNAPDQAADFRAATVVGGSWLQGVLGAKEKPLKLDAAPESLPTGTHLVVDMNSLSESPVEAVMTLRDWLLLGPERVLLVENGIYSSDPWAAKAHSAAAAAFAMSYGRENAPERTVMHIQLADNKLDGKKAAQRPVGISLRDLCMKGKGIGAVRIGADGTRRVRSLVHSTLSLADEQKAQVPKTVLALGGTRGITAKMLESLVNDGASHITLVGRTGPGANIDADKALLAMPQQDRRTLLMTQIKEDGDRPTPAAVEKLESKAQARVEVADTIAILESKGANVELVLGDASDSSTISKAVKEAAKDGRIDLVVHAAGVDFSRMLDRKSTDEIELVLAVKVQPMLHLLSALEDVEVGAFASFSSVAAHFGNAGQTDYAAANAALEALTDALGNKFKDCRACCIAWGPFGDVGMAARPEIAKALEERGVSFIPLETGVQAFRDEVAHMSAQTTGHVMHTGALGALSGGRIELDAQTTGLVHTNEADPGVFLATELESEIPFLDDHRIQGTAVLPGVMGLALIAEAASVSGVDISKVHTFKDVRFNRAVRVPDGRTTEIELVPEDSAVNHDTEWLLNRRFTDPLGRVQSQHHFTAKFGSSTKMNKAPKVRKITKGKSWSHDELYARFFHGPGFQVLEEANVNSNAGHARVNQETLERNAAPLSALLLEAIFQGVAACEMTTGRMGLPYTAVEVRQLTDVDVAAGPFDVYVSRNKDGSFDGVTMDSEKHPVVILKGYCTVDAGPVEQSNAEGGAA